MQCIPQWSMDYMGVNLCDVFSSSSQDSSVYIIEQLMVEAYSPLTLNWNSVPNGSLLTKGTPVHVRTE